MSSKVWALGVLLYEFPWHDSVVFVSHLIAKLVQKGCFLEEMMTDLSLSLTFSLRIPSASNRLLCGQLPFGENAENDREAAFKNA